MSDKLLAGKNSISAKVSYHYEIISCLFAGCCRSCYWRWWISHETYPILS